MGLLDKLKDFFSGSSNSQELQEKAQRLHSDYEKMELCDKISDLVLRISLQNSFDPSIRELKNKYILEQKSLEELTEIHSKLTDKLSALRKRSVNRDMTEIEDAKWTGKIPKDYTKTDLDRWQRGEDR